MLFNSNPKLILFVLLAAVLVYMLNSSEYPNEGSVEGLDVEVGDNSVADNIDNTTEDEINLDELVENSELINTEDNIDSVLNNSVQPVDNNAELNANIDTENTSTTARNMEKLIKKNREKLKNFNAKELLPNEVNDEWFETDFSAADVNVNDDNLIVTDRYNVGVNTVGNSLRNANLQWRNDPPCPKFVVSPWDSNSVYDAL